jgi:3-methyladenine DNA glycosylase AlkD/ribosomal protein S18 acetylase RimI-like enzyme
MRVVYKIIDQKNVTKDFLKDFVRYQQTTEVLFVKNKKLHKKDDRFIDAWDKEKLESISLYLKNLNGVIVGGFDGDKVVGFACVELKIFDGYMNMPYIHVDRNYRGKQIGRNLFNIISKVAIDNKASKLYISGHPSVETQAFYERLGCTLATKINKELYEIEPLDIQLEKTLTYSEIVFEKVNLEFSNYNKLTSVIVNKLVNKIYKFMPTDIDEYLAVCALFLRYDNRYYFSLGTLLLKHKKRCFDIEYFDFFEDILCNHIHGWGEVDQYCYRVLSSMVNKYQELYRNLVVWSDSKNKDVRRASLVSMLTSSSNITCTYNFDKAIFLVEKLKHDEDFHVRKAVGWVLKCLYVTNKDSVTKYLESNVDSLDRMIFRYALEHASKNEKDKLMKL